MTGVKNLFTYWLERLNLGPGLKFQNLYRSGKKATGEYLTGRLRQGVSLLTSKPTTMTPSAQTTISPNHYKVQECGRSKIKLGYIYKKVSRNAIVRLSHLRYY